MMARKTGKLYERHKDDGRLILQLMQLSDWCYKVVGCYKLIMTLHLTAAMKMHLFHERIYVGFKFANIKLSLFA